MIKVKGYSLPNKASEMNIKLYEKLSEVLESKVKDNGENKDVFKYESTIDKYLDVLELLGLPKDVCNELTQEEFIKAVTDFNKPSKVNYKMKNSIEVNGRIYTAYKGKKFSLNVKDGALIEKYARQNNSRYVAEMLAVLFKDESLTDSEHRVNAHIKHKADIFRKELTADIAVPYLMEVAKRILISGQKEVKAVEENEVSNI
jgi:hypothetical protein